MTKLTPITPEFLQYADTTREYWLAKRKFYEYQLTQIPESKPWYDTCKRKLVEIDEILSVIGLSA